MYYISDAAEKVNFPLPGAVFILRDGPRVRRRIVAYDASLENETGTVETGKKTDLLIVDGDPLNDVTILTRVKMVIHNGVIVVDRR